MVVIYSVLLTIRSSGGNSGNIWSRALNRLPTAISNKIRARRRKFSQIFRIHSNGHASQNFWI